MIKPNAALFKKSTEMPNTPKVEEINRETNKLVSHSAYNAKKSKEYHAKIMGQDPRIVDELNPTKTIEATRSFPGLVN